MERELASLHARLEETEQVRDSLQATLDHAQGERDALVQRLEELDGVDGPTARAAALEVALTQVGVWEYF